MLSSTVNPTATILRNYAIAATAVLALSLGVSDLLNNPNRIATQNTINASPRFPSLFRHALNPIPL